MYKNSQNTTSVVFEDGKSIRHGSICIFVMILLLTVASLVCMRPPSCVSLTS